MSTLRPELGRTIHEYDAEAPDEGTPRSLSGGEAAAGDGGNGAEVRAGGDAEFEEALNSAEVEAGGAEAAAGEA